jgi:hypothetical protein
MTGIPGFFLRVHTDRRDFVLPGLDCGHGDACPSVYTNMIVHGRCLEADGYVYPTKQVLWSWDDQAKAVQMPWLQPEILVKDFEKK